MRLMNVLLRSFPKVKRILKLFGIAMVAKPSSNKSIFEKKGGGAYKPPPFLMSEKSFTNDRA